MNARGDVSVSGIAAAIGEPARTHMLYALLDGRARTSTELAAIADVAPSTASVHLRLLKQSRLVKVLAQGKHRYYSLGGEEVARALESLSVLAGSTRDLFVPNTPGGLRAARTCYDHIAGTLGVSLHDRLHELGWLSSGPDRAYDLAECGAKALSHLGVDVQGTRLLRRRFAYACLDWSERRPHIGGAIGAALLNLALERKWVIQNLDNRALTITRRGREAMQHHFGVRMNAEAA